MAIMCVAPSESADGARVRLLVRVVRGGGGSRGGSGLEGGGWSGGQGERGGNGVPMDAVKEAFYDAKSDEAADVDAGEQREVILDPGAQRQSLTEGGVKRDEGVVGDRVGVSVRRGICVCVGGMGAVSFAVLGGGGGDGGAVVRAAAVGVCTRFGAVGVGGRGAADAGDGDVAGAFFLDGGVGDEAADFGSGGVDGAEGEDVEEDEAAVVDEMLDGFAGQREVGVGELGDVRDAVYAVDVGENAGEGKV